MIAIKERPIIFSAPMVQALLDGRKTQTRSMVKVLRGLGRVTEFGASDTTGYDWRFRDRRMLWNELRNDRLVQACPYSGPGDRLWVRETWRIGAWNENTWQLAIDYKDGPCKQWADVAGDDDGEIFNHLWQQSTDDAIKALGNQERYAWEPGQSPCRWRPSIHMPRWASRILLEITDVRLERLQDISEDDAIAEGIEGINQPTGGDDYDDLWRNYGLPDKDELYPWFSGDCIASFRSLWEATNGQGSWGANPWVWVIEFKRINHD